MFFLWFFFYLSPFSSGEIVVSPEGCYEKKAYPCAVVSLNKSTLSRGGNGFYVSGNTFLVFESKNNIQLHRGSIWVHAKKKVIFSTKYGRIMSGESESSEFFVYSEPEAYRISVVEGDVAVEPKGGLKNSITSGRSAFLSTIDYATQSCYLSGATVMDFYQHLKMFAKIFPFGSLSAEKHLAKVRRAVLLASQEDSDNLKDSVARHLASEEEKKIKHLRDEQDARRRAEYLKRLFKLKSNFEEI